MNCPAVRSSTRDTRLIRAGRGSRRSRDRVRPRAAGAFTLIEVTIAGGILFICLFAILGLLANTLRNARSLQRTSVDAGILAAQLSLTNKLSEGQDSGDFEDMYPDYEWKSDTSEVSTNGLFEIDFTVYPRSGQRGGESHMSILLFRPESMRARP